MPSQVRAAHLLIKHEGSRNPVSTRSRSSSASQSLSRRTGQAVTLSYEDALTELRGYQARIQDETAAGGADLGTVFARYAGERSDCASFRNGGDLGFFGPGQMQKPFEDGAFALQPNQMSDVVSTDSGLHLIFRIA